MAYLTIGGTRTDELGLLLASTDGHPAVTDPPELRTSYVDLLGGGFIDLSEAYGDVAYGKREQTFDFVMASHEKTAIEQEATALMGRFHGLRCEFSLSWDPGYTYTGRFDVEAYENRGRYGTVRLHVTADPFKSAGTATYKLRGGTGTVAIDVVNGRKRVRPTIEVDTAATVSYKGEQWSLEPGAYTIDGLLLDPGESTVYVNTSPEMGERTVAYWASYFIYGLKDKLVCDLTGRDTSSGGDAYVSFERYYL